MLIKRRIKTGMIILLAEIDRNRDSDKTNTDWRARPAADSFDDYLPRSGDDSFGDKYRDCYHSDGYPDGYRELL